MNIEGQEELVQSLMDELIYLDSLMEGEKKELAKKTLNLLSLHTLELSKEITKKTEAGKSKPTSYRRRRLSPLAR